MTEQPDRQRRLEALRKKQPQGAKKIDFSEMRKAAAATGRPSGGQANGNLMKSLLNGQDGADNRPPVDRILEFLTDQTPGAELVPGTEVSKERLKRFLQFVKMRIQDGNAPKWADQLRRLLGGPSGKIGSVSDLEPADVNRLVGFLRGRTDQGGGAPAAADAGGAVTTAVDGDLDQRLKQIEQALRSLLELTGKMNRRLDEMHGELTRLKKLDRRIERKARAAGIDEDAEPLNTWFDDLVEDF
jgi:hypothetical protein